MPFAWKVLIQQDPICYMNRWINPFSQLPSVVSRGFQLEWTAAKPKISPFLESWLLAGPQLSGWFFAGQGSLLDSWLPSAAHPCMQQAALPCGMDAPSHDASTETG